VSAPAHIVVVDDSDEIREIYETILSAAGYRVLSCSDAERAFEVIQRERPGLVLTDIGLGVTSGLDLITRLRSDLAEPPLVVACSGFTDFQREAIRRGAHAFLPKPFDADILLAAVAEGLAGKPVSATVSARAHARASALRREAIIAAEEALARLGPKRSDLEQGSAWTVSWLPRYLGFGGAAVALIEQDELRVLAACRTRTPVHGALGESAFTRDVVETSSNLVVPDAERWSDSTSRHRFYAGVPITDGRVAIGALCVFDALPRQFDADDLALLEALGRIDSAALGALDAEAEPFWIRSPMISHAGIRLLVDLALKRSERTCSPVVLLPFEANDASWAAELDARFESARTALASLGGDRYAVLMARSSVEMALLESRRIMQTVRQRGALRGAGAVALDGGAIAARTGSDLLWLADELCTRAVRQGGASVEAVVVRHEAWSTEAAP
jgi:CheY-like chemotaxis protein